MMIIYLVTILPCTWLLLHILYNQYALLVCAKIRAKLCILRIIRAIYRQTRYLPSKRSFFVLVKYLSFVYIEGKQQLSKERLILFFVILSRFLRNKRDILLSFLHDYKKRPASSSYGMLTGYVILGLGQKLLFLADSGD